jgi:hypothetical protein
LLTILRSNFQLRLGYLSGNIYYTSIYGDFWKVKIKYVYICFEIEPKFLSSQH